MKNRANFKCVFSYVPSRHTLPPYYLEVILISGMACLVPVVVNGREWHNLARNIKEPIYIRVNDPTLNNNIGKFNLSHIWDRVLLNTKGLTLK